MSPLTFEAESMHEGKQEYHSARAYVTDKLKHLKSYAHHHRYNDCFEHVYCRSGSTDSESVLKCLTAVLKVKVRSCACDTLPYVSYFWDVVTVVSRLGLESANKTHYRGGYGLLRVVLLL